MKTAEANTESIRAGGGVRRWRVVLAGLVLGTLALVIARDWTAPEILVPVGTPIEFDDFAFSVVEASTFEEGFFKEERRRYLVVTMKVDNRAKAVSYQFRRDIPILVDDRGRMHAIDPEGQAIVDAKRFGPDPLAAPLPAGRSGMTELVYAMPKASENLRIRLYHSSLAVLCAADDLLLGKRRLVVKP